MTDAKKTASQPSNQAFDNAVHICLTVDIDYFFGAKISCASALIYMNSDIHVCFHIISDNSSTKKHLRLEETLNRISSNYSVIYYNISTANFSRFPEFFTPSKMIYSRLMLPEILPVDKVIYLDSDLLVLRDLSIEYENDFGQSGCMAAIDFSTQTLENECVKDSLPEFDKTRNALNSGLLFLSLQTIRQKNVFKEAIQLLHNRGNQLINHDQSAINFALNGDFVKLPAEYNYMVNHYHTGNASNSEFPNAKIIFHFVTSQKPWSQLKPIFPFILYARFVKFIGLQREFPIPVWRIIFNEILYHSPLLSRFYLKIRRSIAKFREDAAREALFSMALKDLKSKSSAKIQEKTLLREVRLKVARKIRG
jgi:lipopolysaccharide biosynthesis glycosyltransferase